MVHMLSWFKACEVLLDQGSNPLSPALADGFLTTTRGKSKKQVFCHPIVPYLLSTIRYYRLLCLHSSLSFYYSV